MSYPPQPPAPPQPPQGPQGQNPQQQYPQQAQYQQPYQQQQYGQYPQAPVQAKTSPLALTAFIMALAAAVIIWTRLGLLGWLLNLAAFILGIVANSQIKKSAGALTGKGYGVAAIVISCVVFGLALLFVIIFGAVVGSILSGALGGLK